MDESVVISGLAALANAVRLRIFRLLVVAGPEGRTPTRIAVAVGVAPNALSFHLKELLRAGLVDQERQGRHLVYRASYGHMSRLLGYLTDNCCRGADCLATDPSAPWKACGEEKLA